MAAKRKRAYRDTETVEHLLTRMSVEEKIGQMLQLDLLTVTKPGSNPIELELTKLRIALVEHKVGSFINNGLGRALSLEEWHYVHQTIQDLIRHETPNQIPLLYGIDSIHGATFVKDATLLPQNMALAATRNPELVQNCAGISAAETRAAGLRWNFAPVLDVGRQPLWSRFPETFGEDPCLASVLGRAAIRGFQGNDLQKPNQVAACLKHFIGYSFPQTGKDRSPALMPEWYLREYFLPPFREAISAGAATVMINSGEVNGYPVHASKSLLTDLLRGELGFRGVIVSDWEDVIRLHTWHKVAASPLEAVRLAVDAGLDISMAPLDFSFFHLLKQLVETKQISEARLNESVRRILTLKASVGLFDNPCIEPSARRQFGIPEYHTQAFEVAAEAVTLLKNANATLPLKSPRRLLITGPASKSVSALHGCWSYSWQGKDETLYPRHAATILDALIEQFGVGRITYHAGVTFEGAEIDVEPALVAATEADVIIVCLGEDAYAETPGDINDLDLPAGQLNFTRRLQAVGKPVVVVLVEGRPRVIREIEPQAAAILLAYWPGSGGAKAIASILAGKTNPSGKLPFTYPRHSNNLLTYDRKHTNLLAEISAPGQITINPARPQWEFGHGLSYTSFEISNLTLDSNTLTADGKLKICVEVQNTGLRPGQEVIELYTSDLYASLTPPGRRLRAFRKIELLPGAKQTVEFNLRPSDLAFVNAANQLVTEPGEFEIQIGALHARIDFVG